MPRLARVYARAMKGRVSVAAVGGAAVSRRRDPALGNLYGRSENRSPQVREMQALVGERRAGGNLVLVSHRSTILALTGVP